MPRSQSVDHRIGTASFLLWIVVSFISSSLSPDRAAAATDAPGFVVEHAVLRAQDAHYVVDARIHFAFSEDNLEAMRNGVALTVIVDVEVVREREGWWNETIVARGIRYRIATQPLTGRYQIRDLDHERTRNYRSFEEMVDALGRLQSVPVIARDRLHDYARYIARIRAHLDIEALPLPLRPLAYLSPHWRLNSAWFEWQIDR